MFIGKSAYVLHPFLLPCGGQSLILKETHTAWQLLLHMTTSYSNTSCYINIRNPVTRIWITLNYRPGELIFHITIITHSTSVLLYPHILVGCFIPLSFAATYTFIINQYHPIVWLFHNQSRDISQNNHFVTSLVRQSMISSKFWWYGTLSIFDVLVIIIPTD